MNYLSLIHIFGRRWGKPTAAHEIVTIKQKHYGIDRNE